MNLFKAFCMASLLLITTPAVAEDAPAEAAAFQASAERGKHIFDTVCIHCHNATHETSAVGCPGLQGVMSRHDAAWLNSWLTSPETFAKTNVKAKNVVAANPYGLVMPTLPEMKNEHDRLDVIEFLKTLK